MTFLDRVLVDNTAWRHSHTLSRSSSSPLLLPTHSQSSVLSAHQIVSLHNRMCLILLQLGWKQPRRACLIEKEHQGLRAEKNATQNQARHHISTFIHTFRMHLLTNWFLYIGIIVGMTLGVAFSPVSALGDIALKGSQIIVALTLSLVVGFLIAGYRVINLASAFAGQNSASAKAILHELLLLGFLCHHGRVVGLHHHSACQFPRQLRSGVLSVLGHRAHCTPLPHPFIGHHCAILAIPAVLSVVDISVNPKQQIIQSLCKS